MNYKKLLCLVLCFCFALGAVNLSGIINAVAQSESELQGEVDRIEGEIAENEQKLEQLEQTADQQKAELEKLESQIEAIEVKLSDVQTQIYTLNQQIEKLTAEYNRLNAEIDQKNKNIAKATTLIQETEQNIEDNKDLLSAKLRSVYMNGNESTLKILMGADSLASFLTRLEMMKRTSENDKKTIEEFKQKVTLLKETKIQLEKDKAIIVENQKKVVETRNANTEKKATLQVKQTEYSTMVAQAEAQYAKIESYVASLDKESAAYKDYITDLKQQEAAANEALDDFFKDYYANQGSLPSDNNTDDDSGSSSSGGSAYYETTDDWAWPVGGGSYYITAYYMDSSYYQEIGSVHYGLDISGGGFYGRSLYAARAGTVVESGNSGDGYGNKVIIDHGDGFMTVYAHNSVNVVSAGDYVSKGQLIAYAGSSGYSTGPHLHYEIRYYGEKIDPAPYHPGYV